MLGMNVVDNSSVHNNTFFSGNMNTCLDSKDLCREFKNKSFTIIMTHVVLMRLV